MKLHSLVLILACLAVASPSMAAPPKRVVSKNAISVEEHQLRRERQKEIRAKAKKRRETGSFFSNGKPELRTNKDGTKTIRNTLRNKRLSNAKKAERIWSNLNQ